MPSEAHTKVEAIIIDSGIIDNRLVVKTNEWLQKKIADATWQIKRGFSYPKGSLRREIHFKQALKALGTLGGE